jgi:hypothetical protein
LRGARRVAFAVVAVCLLGPPTGASAARRVTETPYPFVIMNGPYEGLRIYTNGGPIVPRRFNLDLRGWIVPQANGNTFSFHGNFSGVTRQLFSGPAHETILVDPLVSLDETQDQIDDALDDEDLAGLAAEEFRSHRQFENDLKLARGHLRAARAALLRAFLRGELTSRDYDDADAALLHALRLDKDARAETRDQAMKTIHEAMDAKDDAWHIIEGDEPDPSFLDLRQISPQALDGTAASGVGANAIIGDFTTPSSTNGFVYRSGLTRYGPNFSQFNVIGRAGQIGGWFGGQPAVFNPSTLAPTVLPTQFGFHSGNVFGASGNYFVGFEQQTNTKRNAFERPAIWKEGANNHFKLATPGRFTGGAGVFTVSGTWAYGDSFDHGETGRFRAFEVNLKTNRTSELWRPNGGSCQPLTSAPMWLAAGGCFTPSPPVETLYWWGGQHYVRFPGDIVTAMNTAGLGVGTLSVGSQKHAALFQGGHAYDLNDYLPAGSGWELTQANGISNSDAVVGTGYLNGIQRAFAVNLR